MRVPVTILSGFLGSGKTSLLNHVLHTAHGRRIAVIVNEFGEVGIDGSLVSGGETFVELDNGCLCCALNEDLDRVLLELKARGGFEALLLETTGLADPLPVAWNFNKKEVSDFFRVDALVTVVDCPNLERALRESIEARLQIERADILVFNKVDLVSDGGAAAKQVVRAINEGAVMLTTKHGQVSPSLLLGVGQEGERVQRTEHDHSHGHGHGESPGYDTYSFRTSEIVGDFALEELLYDLPMYVYRCKGIVQTDAEWGWSEVHAVAGRFDVRPFTSDLKGRESALVFIGKELNRDDLEQRCQALLVQSEGDSQ